MMSDMITAWDKFLETTSEYKDAEYTEIKKIKIEKKKSAWGGVAMLMERWQAL